MKLAKRTTLIVFLAILLSALVICANGLADDVQISDVAVVLGSKVISTGLPSDRLAARLDRAYALYKVGVVKALIVSGSTGVEGFDEAEVMRSYLLRIGVPDAKIIVDSKGTNTEETAKNCARLMKLHGFKSVIVVTQYFHVPRTRLALKAYGIDEIHSAHAYFFELRDIYSIAREVLALPDYWTVLHTS